jgi:AraC-like DNA-binding protein
MLTDVPIQVIRIKELNEASAYLPHRHAFFMLFWTTKGIGLHRVNYREYELRPNTVFFTHEGQIHQILKYPEDGWVIIFRQPLFLEYLRINPADEQTGLFDFFNRNPFVVLTTDLKIMFQVLVPILSTEAKATPFHRCLNLNLGVLLCQANRLKSSDFAIEDRRKAEILRKLKVLINQHFRTHRFAPFYSAYLGLSARKLNTLTQDALGKLVNQLIADRLLSEAEVLLGGTNMLMKEIVIELGFADHAHLAYFFRKEKGMTPTSFRRQMHALQEDHTNQ